MKRNGFQVMLGLIGMVRSLLSTMCLAITMGTIGHLVATFLTIFGGYTFLIVAGVELQYSIGFCMKIMVLFAIVRGILRYVEQASNHYIAFKLLAQIRHKIFKVLRKLAPAKLDGAEKGNFISILTSDIELLEVFYAHTISPIAIAFLTSIFMVIFIGNIHIFMGLFALVCYCIIGIVIPVYNQKRGSDVGLDYRNSFGKLNTKVLDNLYGLEEIIQYGQQEKRLTSMMEQTEHLEQKNWKLKEFERSQKAGTDTIILISILGMVLLSSYLVQMGAITWSGAITGVIALMSSFGPTVALSALSNNLNHTLASGNRVLDLLDEKPLVEEITGEDQKLELDIACNKLSFQYQKEEKWILKDFTHQWKQNNIHGILGKSGCGKSTLLKLLMRFYEPTKGNILYGQEDVQKIPTKSLRKQIAYVTQETFLFQDTIENNIKIANQNATREEVIEAAKKASLHEFVTSLQNGYATKLAELGESVSGGERQRIGLARAFLSKAPIIFLDEPTSNLDSLNEGMILKSLNEERENKTILLVSHRKSTMGIVDAYIRWDQA